MFIGPHCALKFVDGGGRDIYYIRARPQTKDESMGSHDRAVCEWGENARTVPIPVSR